MVPFRLGKEKCGPPSKQVDLFFGNFPVGQGHSTQFQEYLVVIFNSEDKTLSVV